MKLFTKEIESQLQKQYVLGNDLDQQEVICKIFNPFGSGTWYIINQDPEDLNYLWAICEIGYGVEVGSVLKNELEYIRICNALPLERDLHFEPVNASKLLNELILNEI